MISATHDHLVGEHRNGHICLSKYTNNEDCVVDYGELGTFTTASPWSHINLEFELLGRRPAVVPATPESIGTFFSLLNRDIEFTQPVIFDLSNSTASLRATPYFKNAKTFIYAHGWTSTSGSTNNDPNSTTEPRSLFYQAFRQMEEPINLILVDWRNGAASAKYWVPATNTRVVGSQVERLIDALVQGGYNKPADFHLSGHSLGAHVAGYAGKYYQQRHNGEKLERITGCDPAGPMFQHTDDESVRQVRLDRSDAKLVDVIHTNAGELDVLHLLDIVNRTDVIDEAKEMLQCSRDCFRPRPTGRPRRAVLVEPRLPQEECLLACASKMDETIEHARETAFEEDPLQVGINVPIGHADFWPNGGVHHNGMCNEKNYFWNLGCNHGFSYVAMAATMRDQCQLSRRCESYDWYKRGYCSQNPSENPGWSFNNSDLAEQESTWPHNYFWNTEYESGNYCAVENKDESESSSQSVATVSLLFGLLMTL